jgi:adenosylcobyric acid synthase
LDRDIVNLPVAVAAGVRAIVVGDIERGGVFASLAGTMALLPPDQRALVGGFVINKMRGDPTLLLDGADQLERHTGIPTLGVLPWIDGVHLDAEDSLALAAPRPRPASTGATALDVAVVRFPHLANATDVDALAVEPQVGLRWVDHAAGLGDPDLVVLPGTKSTVADLAWLRAVGLDRALARTAATILGICGGYQMLGHRIEDGIESADSATGLGLLDLNTTFAPEKLLRQVSGTVLGVDATGYEIRHGRVDRDEPLIQDGDVLGTAWHGLLEGDEVRRKLLSWVAERTGRPWTPGTRAFQTVREAHLDRLADWFGAHVDAPAFTDLIQQGAPEGLPTIPPGGTACSVF